MGRNKASCIHLLPVPQTYQRRNWHAFDIRAIAWRYTRVTTFISPLLLHRQQHVVTASGSNAYAINLSVRAGSPYVSGTFRFKTVYNVEQPPPQFSLSTYFQNCVHERKKRSVRIRQIVRAIEIAIFALRIRTFLQLYFWISKFASHSWFASISYILTTNY